MLNTSPDYRVIVIGGGHAGTEAALAAARTGAPTLLVTQNLDTIGQMSCNPAIGGIGKGHLVREIDALGGAMGRAADAAGIQFRVLNRRKGPAVRATRAQTDRALYRHAIRAAVEAEPNLTCFQDGVADLQVEGGRATGVVTTLGLTLSAPTVVLATGTFLGGRIHVGEARREGGRAGDAPANALAARLRELGLAADRLKTGTPPRIDGRTIDFARLTPQPGDEPRPVFSFMGDPSDHPRQVPCHIATTTPATHELIRANLERSPMFSGAIESNGPRYCPSIEDKVVRFADRDAHQIFVEPEGLDTHEVYPNGISTSLPFDVQQALVQTLPGFEAARITRPGYAIEYDFLDPRGLRPSLESRELPGLYLAGQINGTTGYEEAGAQGLLAGLNAARAAADLPAWTPGRDEAYLGVMVDDLITRGTREPYRMFTSRAEYRLLLREDNADLRLTPVGRELGLVDDHRFAAFQVRQNTIEAEQNRLATTTIRAGEVGDELAREVLGQPLDRNQHLADLLRRPETEYYALHRLPGAGEPTARADVAEQVTVQARYAGYIERQLAENARQERHAHRSIPDELDFRAVPGLSTEVAEKLGRHRPSTLGQAGRIDGVTPAALSLLLVHLHRWGA
ncbi:tRNA uridine 5-carboxymethylaminomethyl modification enzyme [Thiohalospira halophila DSM 15071]|uniref:tRNA uridine 5-carboxymethylaminomethyl modification enzyme MnmG n=1 Tax=Thiohalospira halophila DSM 15071 TaxID=1123397 RepID=A0A1I1REJ8_9GAMM|nr:tRNA uridine-5-carboxymethylaminomethyl(34) synthesis enzyme MnmG [Thiohalospira halophila]SFD32719.1 tRNA uridine 5-carboxymethylaminomethyl modification enzyme [Thiohalospira halophila DSM 15071]